MTSPKDCIEQITGGAGSCDIIEDGVYVFNECTNYQERSINIDFNKGIVEVLNTDGTKVAQRFAIEIKLHELPL